jgi:hypothetical protein
VAFFLHHHSTDGKTRQHHREQALPWLFHVNKRQTTDPAGGNTDKTPSSKRYLPIDIRYIDSRFAV